MIKYLVLFLAFSTLTHGRSADGYPGIAPNWSNARKVQVGTSNTGTNSLVWFTSAQGILTETYFPTIDKAQIKDAQLIATDHKSFFAEEKVNTNHGTEVLGPTLVKHINTHHGNKFSVEHTYFTLENSSVLVDEVTVNSYVDGISYYLLVNSALNNTGYHDNAYATETGLRFSEGETSLNVSATTGFLKKSVGYVGYTDGYQDISADFLFNDIYTEAANGNVAGTAEIKIPARKGQYKFYIVYDFEGQRTFSADFLKSQKEKYVANWNRYLHSMKSPYGIHTKERNLYLRSLYTLRVHEDKLNPGAMIASLSVPWGEMQYESSHHQVGGYHLIWPRDLFHVSLAFISAGDIDAPLRALRFLKRIQYKSGKWDFGNGQRVVPKLGAFPQNVWVDGREYWSGYQLDQVGYPIQLFYHIYEQVSDKQKKALFREFREMLRLALDFIVDYGPWTNQERWEENFGISPSSFSVAAAALKVGAKLFNNPYYEEVAHSWLNKENDNIHTWTFTTNGVYGDGNYYIRIGGCNNYLASWNPNDGAWCFVANSDKWVEQTRYLDQGFLKLALMGLVDADDWRLLTTLEKLNQNIRVQIGKYSGWYRYSFDAYDPPSGKGRLWPLLSGEHGRFAIERFRVGNLSWDDTLKTVDNILESYHFFANDGMMIPEQVYEHDGSGTNAATPLAWSHAEYIKLLWSKKLRANVENLLH